MNDMFLLDTVKNVDDSMIEEAVDYRPKRSRGWIVTQCVMLAALLTVGVVLIAKQRSARETIRYEAVQIGIDMNEKHEHGDDGENGSGMASMIGFVIFNNEPYIYYQSSDRVIPGEKLGTISKQIYEPAYWSELPDMCASFTGDFYAVQGIDPEWAVCHESGTDGVYEVYINHGLRTVFTGGDVIEGRFGVSERMSGVTYYDNMDQTYDERYELDPGCLDMARDFILVLDEGTWTEEYTDADEIMAIRREGGYTISIDIGSVDFRIYVFKNGYASVPSVHGSRFLKFDLKRAKPFLDLIDSHEHSVMLPKTEVHRALRHEELIGFPVYGDYIPKTAPEGFREEHAYVTFYQTDSYPYGIDTSKNAQSVTCEYRSTEDPDKYFKLHVCDMPTYRENVACTDDERRCDAPIDRVSADTAIRLNGPDDGRPTYEIMAYDGEVCVSIFTNCMTPEEMAEMLHRCFDNRK